VLRQTISRHINSACHDKRATSIRLVICCRISLFTFGTVDFAILIVEAAGTYRLVALAAQKAAHVKRILQRIHHLLIAASSRHPHNQHY